jgi:hypothetical protein
VVCDADIIVVASRNNFSQFATSWIPSQSDALSSKGRNCLSFAAKLSTWARYSRARS